MDFEGARPAGRSDVLDELPRRFLRACPKWDTRLPRASAMIGERPLSQKPDRRRTGREPRRLRARS